VIMWRMRSLLLGSVTLLVLVFSSLSVQENLFTSIPPLSAPRVYLAFKEVKSTGTAHHFAFLLNSTDYRILRMDEDHDRMYVGSKDYILSLDLNDINKEPLIIHWPVAPQRRTECVLSGKDINGECGNFIRLIEPWNRTHLYVCGTGAYNPICTYVDRGHKAQALLHQQGPRGGGRTSRAADPSASPEPYAPKEYIFRLEPGKVDSGKGKCPFDPKLNSVSALINGQLYAGVYIDFMGTDSAIFRTLGKHTAMRTDQYNSRWLNDPTFVHAQLIPDSAEKNDDKLYFFFREKASEMGQTPMAQSRIGRICLNDDGGHCCLVNKWSTFLKARLICSVTGADGIETHFDELRDVFIQKTQDTKNPVIYGVFSVSGSVFKGSAICVYSMADVRMVFNGPFAHKEGPNYQWIPYQGKIPYPRPGTVSVTYINRCDINHISGPKAQNYGISESCGRTEVCYSTKVSAFYHIRSDGRVVRTDQGLLLRSLQMSDAGSYQCTSTEKNFKHTLVKLQLVVLSGRTVNSIQAETSGPAPLCPLHASAWTPSAEQYKDLLTILSQPEMGLINQYCQDYWQLGDDPAAGVHRKKDSKELKEQRKPRNRRHHEGGLLSKHKYIYTHIYIYIYIHAGASQKIEYRISLKNVLYYFNVLHLFLLSLMIIAYNQ
uniref:Sema domain, immunoglobulin domain (Ig), short basic domain, secreted, (semaphorin) 3Fa n=1 Tax=Astyanax mexicanus TaxID=7994 RepID=A0A8B9GW10_ASTMX